MNIEPLTNEEIQTLQVDAALRKLGEIDQALVEVNTEYSYALGNFNDARITLELVKAKKEILIERARNLKAFIKGAK